MFDKRRHDRLDSLPSHGTDPRLLFLVRYCCEEIFDGGVVGSRNIVYV